LPVVLALIVVAAPNPRRAWRMLPELAAIVLTLVIYVAIVVGVFPDYAATLTLALDIYAPVRDRWDNLLLSPLFLANAALLGVFVYRVCRGPADTRACVWAVLSFGFLATFLIQGKGWNNHALPGISFALLALAIELRVFECLTVALPGAGQGRWAAFIFLLILSAAPLLFGGLQLLGNGEEHPGLAAAVARVGPQRPKIAALAEQLDFGHPLVRQLGGTWIGRQNCLWISWGVKYLRANTQDPAVALRRTQELDNDVAGFAEDVKNGKPDILIIESNHLQAWARAQPALSGIFDTYVQTANAGAIEIWQPRDR
jgi:hypothetical protein